MFTNTAPLDPTLAALFGLYAISSPQFSDPTIQERLDIMTDALARIQKSQDSLDTKLDSLQAAVDAMQEIQIAQTAQLEVLWAEIVTLRANGVDTAALEAVANAMEARVAEVDSILADAQGVTPVKEETPAPINPDASPR